VCNSICILSLSSISFNAGHILKGVKNIEMVAWPALKLDNCPYPLALGLERFHTGDKKLKHSALVYFGDAPGDTRFACLVW
jgi:hypothetical protein